MTEDRIIDFLDGNLSSPEEEELLHRLAVSPERRTLLKQHLQVRELTSALARKHRYMVPKALTATLFETLATNGYSGPLFHQTSENTDALRASLEKNLDKATEKVTAWRRFKNPIAIFSSLGSFVAGAILMYLFAPGMASVGDKPQIAQELRGGSAEVAASHGVLENRTNSTNATDKGAEKVTAVRSSRNFVSSGSSVALGSSKSPLDNGLDVQAANTQFALRNTDLDLGSMRLRLASIRERENSANVVKNPSVETPPSAIFNRGEYITSREGVAVTNADLVQAVSKNWWDGDGIYSENLTDIRTKTRFGYDPATDDRDPIFQGTTSSLRVGGGVLPSGGGTYSGTLIEAKLSADLTDWLVAKLSFGQFMPYETEALNAGLNFDGVRQLRLAPVLQHTTVVGAELGLRFKIFSAPIELMGGVLSDLSNGIIPRASLFTSVMLGESFSLNMGAEAVLYDHDITASIANKQSIYAYEHPVLISSPKKKELAGFIGPALEIAWHF